MTSNEISLTATDATNPINQKGINNTEESVANKKWKQKKELKRILLEKSIPEPDRKTKSRIINVLIKAAMQDGRIHVARKVIYTAHERLQKTLATDRDALFLWELAFRQITPGIRPFKTYGRGRGKSSSQACKKKRKKYPNIVVRRLRFKKAVMIAAKWLVEVGREKGRFQPAGTKISDEIIALNTRQWRPRTPKKVNKYYKDFISALTKWLYNESGKKRKQHPPRKQEKQLIRKSSESKKTSTLQGHFSHSTKTLKSRNIQKNTTHKYLF